jgi:hypothetical protein
MPRRRRVDRQMREDRERKYRLRAKCTKFIPAPDSDLALTANNFASGRAKNPPAKQPAAPGRRASRPARFAARDVQRISAEIRSCPIAMGRC